MLARLFLVRCGGLLADLGEGRMLSLLDVHACLPGATGLSPAMWAAIVEANADSRGWMRIQSVIVTAHRSAASRPRQLLLREPWVTE